jgi:argininosuccinate lyase
VERGRPVVDAEDVHFAIEKSLYKEVGPVAGKMHTARSRNDQTVTAIRLYLRDHMTRSINGWRRLVDAFLRQAEANASTLMPGYTHLQPGQPILVAHHLLAYGWMFQRDRERLADVRRRVNQLPLGAAALGGDHVSHRPSVGGQKAWDLRASLKIPWTRSATGISLVEFVAAASLVMTHFPGWPRN